MSFILLGLAGNKIQLVPDGTILLHVVIIVVMVAVLSKTLFKPINRILEERERQSEGLLSEAGQMVASVEESFRKYEQALRAARAEGYSILEKQRTETVRAREKEIASTKAKLSESIEREKVEIARQVEEARRTLAVEARKLAVEIGSNVLGRPIRSIES